MRRVSFAAQALGGGPHDGQREVHADGVLPQRPEQVQWRDRLFEQVGLERQPLGCAGKPAVGQCGVALLHVRAPGGRLPVGAKVIGNAIPIRLLLRRRLLHAHRAASSSPGLTNRSRTTRCCCA